jgi:hypothetical protein
LPAGPLEIAVEPTKIQGPELFRLRAVTLTPVTEVITRRSSPAATPAAAL